MSQACCPSYLLVSLQEALGQAELDLSVHVQHAAGGETLRQHSVQTLSSKLGGAPARVAIENGEVRRKVGTRL